MGRIWIALLAICARVDAASASDRQLDHGRELFDQLGSRCQAIGETGQSPHADPPAFRSFGEPKR